MDLLIISAVEFESAPTVRLLKQLGIPHRVAYCGVGPIQAAKNSKKIADAAMGKDVIFLGSCGIFNNFTNIEIITTNLILWMPEGVRRHLSEVIDGVYPPIKLDLPNHNSAIKKMTMLCSSTIGVSPYTNNPSTPYDFDLERSVENLEFYSVAEDIKAVSRSFMNFFAITNEIGTEARMQWKKNFKDAALLTADVVINYIKNNFAYEGKPR
ncbi:MAG: hypothetical protein R3B45_17045 [Bdellovibrionota bacterium]